VAAAAGTGSPGSRAGADSVARSARGPSAATGSGSPPAATGTQPLATATGTAGGGGSGVAGSSGRAVGPHQHDQQQLQAAAAADNGDAAVQGATGGCLEEEHHAGSAPVQAVLASLRQEWDAWLQGRAAAAAASAQPLRPADIKADVDRCVWRWCDSRAHDGDHSGAHRLCARWQPQQPTGEPRRCCTRTALLRPCACAPQVLGHGWAARAGAAAGGERGESAAVAGRAGCGCRAGSALRTRPARQVRTAPAAACAPRATVGALDTLWCVTSCRCHDLTGALSIRLLPAAGCLTTSCVLTRTPRTRAMRRTAAAGAARACARTRRLSGQRGCSRHCCSFP
jgi:hypothetical protein